MTKKCPLCDEGMNPDWKSKTCETCIFRYRWECWRFPPPHPEIAKCRPKYTYNLACAEHREEPEKK